MDNNKSIAGMKSGIESKVTTKRVQAEDGSSIETRVEEVEGGFIKTVDKRFKDDNNEWQYTNPFEEKSMADKLEEYMEGEE